jgi:hypothetical protein
MEIVGVLALLLVLYGLPAWVILRCLDRWRERAARRPPGTTRWTKLKPKAISLVRLASVPLAILAAVVLLTDWIEWPWWIGLGLGSPLGLLFLFDDRFGDALFDGDGVLGDADGGGDLGGGGDGGG